MIDPGRLLDSDDSIMGTQFLTRDEVARRLNIPAGTLLRYESRGWIQGTTTTGGPAGYEPEQLRRIWSVVSMQRDLGLNAAGVEAVLRLHDYIDRLHHSIADLADALDRAVDES